MRNIFSTALALIAFGATDGLAAVPDTLGAGAAVQIGAEALRQQDGYDQDGDPRYQDDYYQDGDARYQDDYYQDRGGYRPGVRVWMDGDHDVFRPGERARVRVRTTEDAFLAVLNIDPRGDVEVLWPRTAYDDGYVEGGRTLYLSDRGSQYLSVGGAHGIGYVFAVASSEPLDTRQLRDYYGRRTVGWDRRLNVYGDPFYAMDRFERMLVVDYEYGDYSTDYSSYHVGSRYRYPRYACYSDYGPWYTSVGAYSGDCDYVRVLLRARPYYYDTRYWRGDRRYYYTRYYRHGDRYDYGYPRRREPQHGYKDGDGGRSTVNTGRPSASRPTPRSLDGVAPPSRTGSSDYQEQEGRGRDERTQEPRAVAPARQRPTLQRRPSEGESSKGETSRGEGSERRREPPARSAEPRREEPRQRDEPRVRETPRRDEPRARETPRSAEPRRDPPPSRSGGERSTPSQRSEPRLRPSTKG